MRSRMSADALTASGTPANSRPTRMMSPSRKAKSHKTGLALRRQKHEPALAGGAPRREVGPGIMGRDRQGVEIVHPGAPEAAVVDSKSRRLDDRRLDAETGAGAHHGAGVLGDIGLEQGEQERRGRLGHHGAAITAARSEKRKRRVERRKNGGAWCRAGAAAAFRPMDIQNDQCEKPRRMLACAEPQRSTTTPETRRLQCGGRCRIDSPKTREALGAAPGRTLRVELTSAATIDGPNCGQAVAVCSAAARTEPVVSASEDRHPALVT